jgi:hypothetical protein
MIVAHKGRSGLWNYCVVGGPFGEIIDECKQGFRDRGGVKRSLLAGLAARGLKGVSPPFSECYKDIQWMTHAEYAAWRRQCIAVKNKARKARIKKKLPVKA